MDIFVLGKRAAQWLSEQLLGPRRTPAEPAAPRLWRGPGGIDCDQAACQWRCSSDGSGGYAWVLELSCPTACSCPQPAIVCDSDNENSAYLTQCTATSPTTTTTGCSLYVCIRRCQDDGTGNYAWVVEIDCPTSCDCPIPGSICDGSNFGEAVSLSCQTTSTTTSSTTTSVNCSSYQCIRRCQDDGTGNYAWVVEIDCPTSCDCPLPGASCDAINFGEALQVLCVGPGAMGCVWFCEGGSYRLVQIGCPSADCCCNPPTVPCDSQTAGQYIALGCNCPTSTTQPRCENYCWWTCGWSDQHMADVWLLRYNECDAAAGCICDPPSPRTCSIPGQGTATPCYRPESTSSTTTSGGTTTSADQCAQYTCKWLCWNQDGQFYWQRIESCPQECSCNNGYAPPSEDCVCATVGQVRIFACAGDTTTTGTCVYEACWWECQWNTGTGQWEIRRHRECPQECVCRIPELVPGLECPRFIGGVYQGWSYLVPCEQRNTTTTTSSTTTSSTTTTDTTTTDTTTTDTTTTDTTTSETTTSIDCSGGFCDYECVAGLWYVTYFTCDMGCMCPLLGDCSEPGSTLTLPCTPTPHR
jgi:hypothetical protein